MIQFNVTRQSMNLSFGVSDERKKELSDLTSIEFEKIYEAIGEDLIRNHNFDIDRLVSYEVFIDKYLKLATNIQEQGFLIVSAVVDAHKCGEIVADFIKKHLPNLYINHLLSDKLHKRNQNTKS